MLKFFSFLFSFIIISLNIFATEQITPDDCDARISEDGKEVLYFQKDNNSLVGGYNLSSELNFKIQLILTDPNSYIKLYENGDKELISLDYDSYFISGTTTDSGTEIYELLIGASLIVGLNHELADPTQKDLKETKDRITEEEISLSKPEKNEKRRIREAKEMEKRRIREAKEKEKRRIREAKEMEKIRIREAKEKEKRRIREAERQTEPAIAEEKEKRRIREAERRRKLIEAADAGNETAIKARADERDKKHLRYERRKEKARLRQAEITDTEAAPLTPLVTASSSNKRQRTSLQPVVTLGVSFQLLSEGHGGDSASSLGLIGNLFYPFGHK